MTEINFKCKKCRKEFDCEVGKITFGMRLSFEKDVICPHCGKLKTEEQSCELELTEWGQTQVAELYFSEGENEAA
ncbi:MAG: hypothetical protein QME12_08805 [Nanoarchaeota archaeon]|nr:hypothetical protein [Nanoarchaeota archaeon]